MSFSQGIRDSVFHIKQVTVISNQIFKKEKAGMKQTRIDSIVLTEKINASLSELLSQNTSVFIKSNGRGALSTASFRGTTPSHTQVTWNGININSPMLGMVDFSLIPVYIIDDVNLKHGAASIADQSGGLGGSVNIGNSADWNNKTSVKCMAGVGSYNTYNSFLQFNIGNKKIQSKSRIYYNYSKNDYTFLNKSIGNINPQTGEITNPLDTNKNADYMQFGFLQELYFRTDNKNIFSLKWWGQKADRTIPQATSYEGPDNSNLNNQVDIDNKIVTDYKHYFDNKNKLFVRTGFSQKQLDYKLENYVPGIGLIPAIYSQSSIYSSYNNISFFIKSVKTLTVKLSIDANFHNVNSKDSVSKTGYNENRDEFSGFMSISKEFFEKININIMLRQDFVDNNFTPFIPYVGVDYKPFAKYNFIIKGNIARNYHQPTLNDLYWQPGGNPDLLPEDGFGYETGIEYQTMFQNFALSTEITAYYNDIDNWIIWIPSYKGYWEPRNIKKVISKGVEINTGISGSINKLRYRVNLTYAYTNSKNYGDLLVWGDESYGKQLVYIPLHSGNFMANINYKGFFITWQHNSYSERYTTSSNNITRRDWLYPYFMNDLSCGKVFNVNKNTFSAELKIYNLFNETYHSVLYRPMPGINFLLLLSAKF
jgi:iron complex outermembrane receptor protein